MRSTTSASRLKRTVRAIAGLALLVAAGGCATTAATPVPENVLRALPPMKTFGAAKPSPARRANAEMARDIADLTMQLENGTDLPVFTRFDEPVTIALTGAVTPIFEIELDRLVARLRKEAGIDVRRTDQLASASITIEAIRSSDLNRVVPTAACFVLPQRVSWTDFRGNARRRDLNWTDLKARKAATIFIPADVSPQEIRDCLHEETAQALGPVNDLYRLDDSIFNDDNMHSVLTGFDMLVLRTTYDPALATGMSRAQVEAALPGILARINPAGENTPARPFTPSPAEWRDAISTALSPGRNIATRRTAALRALSIAQDEGWQDSRLALSLMTAARLSSGKDGAFAFDAFLKARTIYESRPDTAIHAANVGIQLAAFALAAGDYETAIRVADEYIPVARRAENAALLSDFLLVRADAYAAQGYAGMAARSRADGFGWARYGLRSDKAVLRRAAEIDALVSPPANS